jgi:hypothetical protein
MQKPAAGDPALMQAGMPKWPRSLIPRDHEVLNKHVNNL